MVKKGKVPFYEPGLEDLVKRNIEQGRLKFTTRIGRAVSDSLVVFIAVGTPPRGDGSADLKYIDEVSKEIAAHIDGYKVIVTKSTVPVGTGMRVRDIISNHRGERIDFDGAFPPAVLHGLDRRERDGSLHRSAVPLGLCHREPGHPVHFRWGQLPARRKTPRAVGQHPHAEAEGLGIGEAGDLLLARAHRLIAVALHADVCVSRAGLACGIERAETEGLDAGVGLDERPNPGEGKSGGGGGDEFTSIHGAPEKDGVARGQ